MLFYHIIDCSSLYPLIDGQSAEHEKSVPILNCIVLMENRIMYFKILYPKLRKKLFSKLGTQNSENFKTMFPKLFQTTKIFVNKTPKPLINFLMKRPFLPQLYFQIKVNVKRHKIKDKTKGTMKRQTT